jgi:hypothetical protein
MAQTDIELGSMGASGKHGSEDIMKILDTLNVMQGAPENREHLDKYDNLI